MDVDMGVFLLIFSMILVLGFGAFLFYGIGVLESAVISQVEFASVHLDNADASMEKGSGVLDAIIKTSEEMKSASKSMEEMDKQLADISQITGKEYVPSLSFSGLEKRIEEEKDSVEELKKSVENLRKGIKDQKNSLSSFKSSLREFFFYLKAGVVLVALAFELALIVLFMGELSGSED